MILDSIENAERYYAINPGFKKAFEFLKTTNIQEIKKRVDIDGDRVFALGGVAEGVERKEVQLEIHKKYIDIQFNASGNLEIGWKPTQDCTHISKPFDEESDGGLFADEPDAWISLNPGQFAVFFPEDGHAPGAGQGSQHRIIVKVLV